MFFDDVIIVQHNCFVGIASKRGSFVFKSVGGSCSTAFMLRLLHIFLLSLNSSALTALSVMIVVGLRVLLGFKIENVLQLVFSATGILNT